jgi:hypothetical protein
MLSNSTNETNLVQNEDGSISRIVADESLKGQVKAVEH